MCSSTQMMSSTKMRIVNLVLSAVYVCFAMETDDAVLLDRYIIACHTTDFTCFKHQYSALRDHVIRGNRIYGIHHYEPFQFIYEVGVCIKITGLEESELIGISMDSKSKEFALTIKLPFHIAETVNTSLDCIQPTTGALKKFSGNATLEVKYPYELRINNAETFMVLQEENIDMVVDIPDLSRNDRFQLTLFQLSDWAYSIVQNMDAAHDFALPYTSRLRLITELLPMHRFLLLYPGEQYDNLNFKFIEQNYSKTLSK